MTTASWSTPMAHSTDADFRAWVSEISYYLQLCGLVQTADTGQITPYLTGSPLVTKPGTNTDAGYEIYYLNDSLTTGSPAAPLYIKLGYGTGSSTTYPRLTVQIGTGSDGSGNLTGQTSSVCAQFVLSGLAAGSFPSYCCVTEGFVMLSFKWAQSASYTSTIFFAIGRTCDASGAYTSLGACLFGLGGGNSQSYGVYSQSVRFDSPAETFLAAGGNNDSSNNFWLPGTETTTSVSGDTQATVAMAPFPQFTPILGMGCALLSELPAASTATITFVGSTPHTYIQVGPQGRLGARMATADDYGVGILALWE